MLPFALVPTLSLGIPGESFTAMMLTVLIIHGVDPGPALFEKKAFVSGLEFTLRIMNSVIVGLLLVGTRWIAKLSSIPGRLLGVIIICLALVGTHSTS